MSVKMDKLEQRQRKKLAERLHLIANAIETDNIGLYAVAELVQFIPTRFIPTSYRKYWNEVYNGSIAHDNTKR